MPARTTRLGDASRLAVRMRTSLGEEFRNARFALGLTQSQIGQALGISRNYISLVEQGKVPQVTLEHVVRHSAVVGLKPSLRFFPAGGGLRDAAQLRYIAKFVDRVGNAWRVRLDAPMPLPGDLRAIDVVLEGACVIAVEIVTRLHDVQALIRSSQLKQRDFGAVRLVIVVSGSHGNRRALAEARPSLVATFDLDSQRVLSLLARGRDPGRDAIVVLD